MSGTAASVLAALTQDAAGTSGPNGTVASGLPAFTQYADGYTRTAPAPPSTFGELPEAWLYDKTGHTLAGKLQAIELSWQHTLSKPGAGSLTIPLSDPLAATLMAADRPIVKFSDQGAIRFGIVIRSHKVQLAKDGTPLLVMDGQLGIGSLLNDATVHPEMGLTRVSGDDRTFGYMSIPLGWIEYDEWPQGVEALWGTGVHGRFPSDFAGVDQSAHWIGHDDPNSTVPDGTTNYFRGAVRVTESTNAEVLFAADNYGELWHQGEMIVPWQRFDFRHAARVQLTLDAGIHIFAAKCQNTAQPAAYAGDPNPTGVIFTLYPVNRNGDKSGGLLLHSDYRWLTNDNGTPPGHFPAQIARLCHDEAITRNVIGPRRLTRTYGVFRGTDGEAWTAHRRQVSVPVRNVKLADFQTQLAEYGVDFDVDAATMTSNAYNRKGSDKSSTQKFHARVRGGLVSFESERTDTRVNSVGMHLGNGTWREVVDSASVTAMGGKIETGMDAASTSADETGSDIAQSILQQNAAPLVTATADSSSALGPQIYTDVELGDTAEFPGHGGVGTAKYRLLEFTVQLRGDKRVAYPSQIVVDTSV